MNLAKVSRVCEGLSGAAIFFSFNLMMVWNLAGAHPFINPFRNNNQWVWSLVGVGLGLLTVFNSVKAKTAFRISDSNTKSTEDMEDNLISKIFVLFSLRKAVAGIIGGSILLVVSVGLNIYSMINGNWKLNTALLLFSCGAAAPWLLWNKFLEAGELKTHVKSKSGVKKGKPKIDRGSAYIIEDLGETFKLTNPIIVKAFGKNIKPPEHSFTMNWVDVRDFRILASIEEYEAFRSVNIDVNIAFLAKAQVQGIKFMIKPEIKPNYLIEEGSSDDIMVYLGGKGFAYLLPFQPQFGDVLFTARQKHKLQKKAA